MLATGYKYSWYRWRANMHAACKSSALSDGSLITACHANATTHGHLWDVQKISTSADTKQPFTLLLTICCCWLLLLHHQLLPLREAQLQRPQPK
jgi:hypothetical protein